MPHFHNAGTFNKSSHSFWERIHFGLTVCAERQSSCHYGMQILLQRLDTSISVLTSRVQGHQSLVEELSKPSSLWRPYYFWLSCSVKARRCHSLKRRNFIMNYEPFTSQECGSKPVYFVYAKQNHYYIGNIYIVTSDLLTQWATV